jgi:hypothetical protein
MTEHASQVVWTNESVKSFAGTRDPVAAVTERARRIVMQAMDKGWTGPPFDPVALATEFLGLHVVSTDEVMDARTVSTGARTTIEYNPNRPRERRRYSIAHEIAHTIFPDYAERVRHRGSHHDTAHRDDWQLEMLCNIAAAEFLMPVGTLPSMDRDSLKIDRLVALRPKYDVSMEAVLIRAVRVADAPCAVFTASRIESGHQRGAYRIDYVIPAYGAAPRIPSRLFLGDQSCVADCTAIGYTAKADEHWGRERLHVECVGIPPFPRSSYPRVAGIVTGGNWDEFVPRPPITIVTGNALQPRGGGNKLLVHVVNDTTPNWGGNGFAAALRRAYPDVQQDFRAWGASRAVLKLGRVRLFKVDDSLSVASLIAQRGYGEATGVRRLRYAALEQSLEEVGDYAVAQNATVHMPRIGSGQGGAAWSVVQEIVMKSLCDRGVEVVVYDLPNTSPPAQASLSFSSL